MFNVTITLVGHYYAPLLLDQKLYCWYVF